MRKTKYVMSGGLAFSEDKDMEKLHRFSLKGWHVKNFNFMGYILEKEESSNYIYSVDYRSLREGEAEEYFDFFSSSGWSHITSDGDTHLFRALPGAKPIYSDCNTVADKHDNLGSPLKWPAIALVIITTLLWLGTSISSDSLRIILAVVAVVLSMIAIPTAWTVLTIYNNKWKFEGKKGLVNLTKTIPPLFFLGAVICLVVIGGTSNIMRMLAYMVIGAIALPTAIWAIMSVSNRWGKKRA